MTDDSTPLEAEYAILKQKLATLDRELAVREAAKAAANNAARSVGAQLARLGHAAELAGVRFDNEVARRLYWSYPDVHVAEIANPMRVHEGQVSRYVGTGEAEKPCSNECGRTIVWHMRNRTDAHRQPRYCDECQAMRDARREQDRLEWTAREDAEHRATVEVLRAAVEGGVQIRRYADFPGVPHTWEIDENGVPLALRDER
ncbi:hypothetical protein [Microbacterium foliorum]|uniref:hypothetical protein n=1 Tax=Microbacterium foliorum TaxID=104336 RepID=UPI001E048557|nr:hypothetical protein [Microbacterium foliorum]CAH0137975.1 hypothetical protein SRABI03_00441 [Microbacterium foliorum]CAH0209075.1 hypothetical protein SRABI44_02122 [Microbacterium foliorum]